MKALIKNKPTAKAEVFKQSDWLDWMDSDTGYPLNTFPYKYGLCEDAISDNPDDYDITIEIIDGVKYYTATIKEDYTPDVPDMSD